MAENVTENVSLRMGKEDVQRMDDFLRDHPELGGRSLFIRTAINRYINRDADVAVEDRKGEGVFVHFTHAEMAALKNLVARGKYLNEEEIVREIFRKYMYEPAKEQKEAQSVVEAATSTFMME